MSKNANEFSSPISHTFSAQISDLSSSGLFLRFLPTMDFFSSSDQRVSTGHYSFRNEELPRDFRLKENSFQMTTFIFDDIAAKTEERLNLVRMDTDKATEESKEALEKVRRRFFDDILFPKLIVKAIRYLIYYQRFTFL